MAGRRHRLLRLPWFRNFRALLNTLRLRGCGHALGALALIVGALHQPNTKENTDHDGGGNCDGCPPLEPAAHAQGAYRDPLFFRCNAVHLIAAEGYPQRLLHMRSCFQGCGLRLQCLQRRRQILLPLEPRAARSALIGMVQQAIVARCRQFPCPRRNRVSFELTAFHDMHLAATPEIPCASAACCSFLLSMSWARCRRERMVPRAHPSDSAACAYVMECKSHSATTSR